MKVESKCRVLFDVSSFSPWQRPFAWAFGVATGLSELNRAYGNFSPKGGNVFAEMLDDLNVTSDSLGGIDQLGDGPAVVLCNHPYGGVEGLILAKEIMKTRSDLKVMGNGLLARFEELQPHLITVSPYAGKEKENVKGMLEAMRWLREGHVLLVFPAGEVSSFSFSEMRVTDPQWSAHIGRMIKKSGAQVLPAFIEGRNGWGFQFAGMIHPILRTALLVRELMNKRGKRFLVRFGKALNEKQWSRFSDHEAMMTYLKGCSYALEGKGRFRPKPKRCKPLIAPVDPELCSRDVEALGEKQLLLERREVSIYVAKAKQLPHLMDEIARLREESFRASDEGTGQEKDRDAHDEYYDQMFVWHREERRVIGAYRLGVVSEILATVGPSGIYSHGLFRCSPSLLKDLADGGLDLGRSFVTLQDQRSPLGLPMLWKGIARYLELRPEITKLFGCVSIGSDYQQVSIDMMVDYLEKNKCFEGGDELVRPRRPYRIKACRSWLGKLDLSTAESLGEAISHFEGGARGLPTLLKHYLRVGAKVISFNVDPQFSDVVDALILIDIEVTDERVLRQFLSQEHIDVLKGRSEFQAGAAE